MSYRNSAKEYINQGSLANEYINEADILKKYIANFRKSHAKEIFLQESSICRRLNILCAMYMDLRCTGNMLKGRCSM